MWWAAAFQPWDWCRFCGQVGEGRSAFRGFIRELYGCRKDIPVEVRHTCDVSGERADLASACRKNLGNSHLRRMDMEGMAVVSFEMVQNVFGTLLHCILDIQPDMLMSTTLVYNHQYLDEKSCHHPCTLKTTCPLIQFPIPVPYHSTTIQFFRSSTSLMPAHLV